MKQLLIGPRLNHDGVTIGGSEVLFENWLAYCDTHGHSCEVIDGNKFNYPNRAVAMVSIVAQILRKAPHSDVIFLHGSRNDYYFLAPVVAAIARTLGKPFFLKKFGGDFDRDFAKAPRWVKPGVEYALRHAAACWWETKRLMPFGRKYNPNALWCPNTRVRPAIHRDITQPLDRRKFVFMAHVRREKGMDELLEAFRMLGPDYSIDIYGTLMGYTPSQLDGHYKGVAEAADVPRILSQYQVLVLPSWREGYPGTIIEAFGAGLPVVASSVGGMVEMVEEGVNGVFCNPKDPQSLADAIRSLDKADFQAMSEAALKSFDTYDGDRVNASIIETLASNCK